MLTELLTVAKHFISSTRSPQQQKHNKAVIYPVNKTAPSKPQRHKICINSPQNQNQNNIYKLYQSKTTQQAPHVTAEINSYC